MVEWRPVAMTCPRCRGSGKVADSVAARLKALREARGLVLRDVEQAIGIAHATLWRVESGKTKGMPFETLVKLARYYETTTDFILTGETAP